MLNIKVRCRTHSAELMFIPCFGEYSNPAHNQSNLFSIKKGPLYAYITCLCILPLASLHYELVLIFSFFFLLQALLEYEKHKMRCGELPFTDVASTEPAVAGNQVISCLYF